MSNRSSRTPVSFVQQGPHDRHRGSRSAARRVLHTTAIAVVSAATAIATFGASSQATPVHAASFTFNPGLPLLDQNGVNTGGAEPSIRVDTRGHVYVDGPVGVPTGGCPFWQVHPDFQGPNGHAYNYQGKFDTDHGSVGGGDCDIATGGLPPVNNFDNVAVSSLSLANLTVNRSSDGGNTFQTPANTVGQVVPGVDRQWQAADTGIGENYITVHDVATSNIQIATSIDGGFTYLNKQPAITTTPNSCGQPTGCFSAATMNNHFGNIVVNKATHQLYTIYVAPQTAAENAAANAPGATSPNEHVVYIASGTPTCLLGACAPGNPIASINWTDHIAYVAPSGTDLAHIFPVIAIDAGGTVYASWSDTHHIFMTHSATPDTDGTFSAPVQVDQGTSHSTMFPWLVGGKAGAVDAVWYSAQLNSAPGCGTNSGTDGDANGVNNNCHNVWTTQFAQSQTSGTSFSQSTASATIHNGSICDQGLTCSTNGGNRTLLDYFQVDLDPAGAANIAYATDVATPGTAQITYTRQCSGPSATQSADINYGCGAFEGGGSMGGPVPPTCNGAHVVTDATGDATNPLGAPNPPSGTAGNTEQVDITNVAFSADSTNLTTTMTIANLPAAKPQPVAGTADTYYYVAWTAPNGNTYATLAQEPSTAPFEFEYGKFDPNTNQLTTSNIATGTITPGSPGTISVTVPRSGVGSPTIPVSPGTPAAVHHPFALTISGEGVLGSGLVFVHPDDRAPNADYGADWSVCGPGVTVPEAPVTSLIAVGGAGVIAFYGLSAFRRRRRGQSTAS